jgi:hypothetical protein
MTDNKEAWQAICENASGFIIDGKKGLFLDEAAIMKIGDMLEQSPVAPSAQPVAWRRPGPLGAQLRNSLDAVAPYDRHRWEPLYAASAPADKGEG